MGGIVAADADDGGMDQVDQVIVVVDLHEPGRAQGDDVVKAVILIG